MKTRYHYKNHPEVIYEVVWEDDKGKLLEIVRHQNQCMIGQRYFVVYLDISKFYDVVPVEKWLVLKEWDDRETQR